MNATPVAQAVVGGLTRRRVQTVVIALVVLISTAAAVLAAALLAESSAPFEHAFAARRGAEVTAIVDPAKASPAQLAATTRLPQVTAAAGPFAETTIGIGCTPVTVRLGGPNGIGLEQLTLAGRASPDGPVDDVALASGHWVRGPGQVVLQYDYMGGNVPVGSMLTVTGLPGTPRLTVVGIAASVTGSADAWVLPAEIAKLRPPGTPASAQMLYRFRYAATTAAIDRASAAITSALPAGAVSSTQSYLPVKVKDESRVRVYLPFVIAFGIIGLVLSVLIVANVVSGAVAAGYSRIGILKSIGFTPGQIVAAYTSQGLAPAAVGCLAGVVAGNWLARPLLAKAAYSYGIGVLGVPAWVNVTAPAAMCCLTGIAAVVPALRAGRLSAVAAISAGRAPRTGRGYAAHRVLSKLPLPRPVTIGLAGPFARPARTAVTLAAAGLGATAVTFAVGLNTSLNLVQEGQLLTKTVQVKIFSTTACGAANAAPALGPSGTSDQGLTARQQDTIEAAIHALPQTTHSAAEADVQATVAGLATPVQVTAYRGDASWTDYPMVSGRWYSGPDQVEVPKHFLTVTNTVVGETITLSFAGRQIPVRIVGVIFSKDLEFVTDWQTLAAADPGLAPDQYAVGLRAGTSLMGYRAELRSRLGPGLVPVPSSLGVDTTVLRMLALIGALTLLLAITAALGVLNTVVMQTRERVHDLGVFKAIGMTSRQTIAMVVCSVTGTGIAAGVLAVPAGIALHRLVLPVMFAAVDTGLPASFLHVYGGWEIIGLALAGPAIAVAGALLPAGWAAKTPTASALRAE
ncbi:MAG TPA: FtsX-like permease family protein [Streptosporangiaceae bacterium]|nr:FtsX-like permease family protein [Streptosporangiaceae bacterium]